MCLLLYLLRYSPDADHPRDTLRTGRGNRLVDNFNGTL